MDPIRGIAFAGYRSFPSTGMSVLYPLSRINLIAGQNNAGKSNVLRVIADTLNRVASTEPWDRPLGDSEHRPVRLLAYDADEVVEWFPPSGRVHDFSLKMREFVGALKVPALSAK